MKKIFTLTFLIFCYQISTSQTWFDVGIKGGIGSSFMYNSQIFDKQEVTHKFKPGYTFGGKFGFNFIQEHQITFDVMQTSFTQGFIYSWQPGIEKTREFTFTGLDLLLMYRSNRNGTYFEIGPQWSTMSKVTYSDQGDDLISPISPADLVNKSNFSIAAGFGGYVFGTDNFGVTTGLRINYILNDMATETGKNINFPMLTPADKSDPTHNLAVMFIVEVNYDFGYLVSSRCGQRSKLFVF